jgi:hypothetical protein
MPRPNPQRLRVLIVSARVIKLLSGQQAVVDLSLACGHTMRVRQGQLATQQIVKK